MSCTEEKAMGRWRGERLGGAPYALRDVATSDGLPAASRAGGKETGFSPSGLHREPGLGDASTSIQGNVLGWESPEL